MKSDAIDPRPLRRRLATAFGVLLVAATAGSLPEPARAAPRGERWSAAEQATLGAMRLSRLPPPPADPSNAVATRAEAVALGRQLFADPRLSRNGGVACSTCHDPDRGFQDGRPRGQGIGTGTRRTMTISGAAHGPWYFWDGRKDSLWSQALGPLEDPAEHGTTRAGVVHVLAAHHRTAYEALFGALPSLRGIPASAGPLGETHEQQAWARLSLSQRDDVNRAFANAGKAIAAYERTLLPGPSRFDRYVAAVLDGHDAGQQVLTAQEVRGLRLFVGKGRCATCHNGPLLTDHHFHNTGVPQHDATRPDRGRAAALARVQDDEFNCLGPYSDAAGDACTELRFIAADDARMEGAFKTTGLRNVAERAPYMHAGQFATLDEVVAHYMRSPPATVGRSELAPAGGGHGDHLPIRLDESEARDLVAFLKSLSETHASANGPGASPRGPDPQ